MREALSLCKYSPPPYPEICHPRRAMGVHSFLLLPADLHHAPVCVDSVFPLLDTLDAAAVRRERWRWASWLHDEAAMNAPFLSLLREQKA